MAEKKPIGEKHIPIGMTTAKKFEKMESHVNQHERPTETLNDFTASNFNKDGSSSTYIWPQGIHTDLVKLVITHLQFPLDSGHLNNIIELPLPSSLQQFYFDTPINRANIPTEQKKKINPCWLENTIGSPIRSYSKLFFFYLLIKN